MDGCITGRGEGSAKFWIPPIACSLTPGMKRRWDIECRWKVSHRRSGYWRWAWHRQRIFENLKGANNHSFTVMIPIIKLQSKKKKRWRETSQKFKVTSPSNAQGKKLWQIEFPLGDQYVKTINLKMGTINLFPREWSRLGATLNMFLHKTRSPFHFHLNRYIYTKMNQSLMPTRRIDRDLHHQRGGLSVIICVVTLFLASLHLEPIDQLRCGVPFGFFFFFCLLDHKFFDVVLPCGWKQRADALKHGFDVGAAWLIGLTDQLHYVRTFVQTTGLKEDSRRVGGRCETSARL